MRYIIATSLSNTKTIQTIDSQTIVVFLLNGLFLLSYVGSHGTVPVLVALGDLVVERLLVLFSFAI